MKKFLTTAVLSLTLMVSLAAPAFAAGDNYTTCMAAIDEHRTIQSQAHQAAQAMRKMGYSEDSAYVQSAKTTWKEAAAEIAAYERLEWRESCITRLTNTNDLGFCESVGWPIWSPHPRDAHNRRSHAKTEG